MIEKIDSNDAIENLDYQQVEIMKKLVQSQSTKQRVKLFWKIMDTYWVDAIVSLIPELGDAWVSLVASSYLLFEWKKMGLKFIDMLKILWYQSADILVWAIPFLWDIADYFFKSNKRSAKIFEKHFENLKKEALKRWISQVDIQKIEDKNKVFLEAISKHLENREKTS
jgi:hypothetical protein